MNLFALSNRFQVKVDRLLFAAVGWPTCAMLVAVGGTIILWTSVAESGLIVNSWDARSAYPSSAAEVYTSDLPFFGPTPPASPDAASLGIRTTRILAQTFDVSSTFNVQSIFMGYRLNPDNANGATIRLLQIPDVGAAYSNPTVLASVNVTTPTPYGGTGERYFALQLDWQDILPLTLTPQPGAAGYALELVGQNPQAGSPNGSPIAFVYRTNNPYALGRALDVNTPASPTATDDFVVAITAVAVPEPSTFLLSALCVLTTAVSCQRARSKRNSISSVSTCLARQK